MTLKTNLVSSVNKSADMTDRCFKPTDRMAYAICESLKDIGVAMVISFELLVGSLQTAA